MILVIGGIKGGTGKSTLAANLTVMRAAEGKRLLLVDADEQKSTSAWAQQRESAGLHTPWVTISLSGKALCHQINKLKAEYDDIIIDVGGRDTTSQRSALSVADKFLIPFQPRSLDVWTIGDVKTLIDEITSVNNKLQSYAIINCSDANGNDNADALEIVKECDSLIALPYFIGRRKTFGNASATGQGVTEVKGDSAKAIAEMQVLYGDLFNRNDICLPYDRCISSPPFIK